MRVLALDIGEKRIGVAVSDPAGRIATPLAVIDAKRTLADGADLARIIDDYSVEAVVIGLPLSMDGAEGPQARRVRALAEKLVPHLGVPYTFADERLSSTQASRAMSEAGVSARDQRGKLDAVAASLFLQSYLDATASVEDGEQDG
jgi:putative Holliday junction resolvase